jgi:FkbM family methyltransferase
MRSGSTLMNRLYRGYACGPDHPMKLRLVRWLERRIFPSEGIAFDVDGGIKMYLHPNHFWEYHLLKHGRYQPGLNAFMQKNLVPGDKIVIAGISFGQQLILASRCVGVDGRVIGVDPHPAALVRTMRNLSINNLGDNVLLVSAALGERPSIFPLRASLGYFVGWGSFLENSTNQNSFYVQVESLPTILQRLNVKKPDMFLLDVIGYELPVLAGLTQPYLPRLMTVVVHPSVMEKTKTTFGDYKAKLTQLGYSCWTLEGQPAESADDLRGCQLVAVQDGVPAPKWIEKDPQIPSGSHPWTE